MEKTKIDIISGFLGAGKTTLIKKLLKDAFQGEQVVLIENEFGEIGTKEANTGSNADSLLAQYPESRSVK